MAIFFFSNKNFISQTAYKLSRKTTINRIPVSDFSIKFRYIVDIMLFKQEIQAFTLRDPIMKELQFCGQNSKVGCQHPAFFFSHRSTKLFGGYSHIAALSLKGQILNFSPKSTIGNLIVFGLHLAAVNQQVLGVKCFFMLDPYKAKGIKSRLDVVKLRIGKNLNK